MDLEPTLVEMVVATPSRGETGVDRYDCLPAIQEIKRGATLS